MVKKLIAAIIVAIALSVPAMAIEPPEGVKSPFKSNVAPTSVEFNRALEAYGLSLTTDAAKSVPSTYAKVDGDKVMFSDKAMAYTPEEYNSILIAYGIMLKPEDVSANPIPSNYASVKNDSIMFADREVAYKPAEWVTILKAYSLAM